MAPGQPTDDDESDGITRREALRQGGIAALTVGTIGVMGNSASADEGEYGTVVDLGDEGLSSGDTIDPYIEEHYRQGNEVHIPPGEYVWNGSLSTPSAGDAALIGDGDIGDVVFQLNDTLDGRFGHDSGTVLFRNVTIRGENPEPKAGFTIDAGADATIIFEHIRAPDGATQEEDRFLYAAHSHDGEAYIRNSYWTGFGNNGGYTDNGRMVYENCVAYNNNISGMRIGTGDSEVYNCLIMVDGDVPTDGQNSENPRGIRIREPGEHVIENCDFYYLPGSPSGSPVELRAPETAGVMRNCRIHNDTDRPVVKNKSDDPNWTAEDVHICGDGNLEMEGVEEASVTRGEDADHPRTDFAEILGAPIDEGPTEGPHLGPESEDGSSDDGSSSPEDFEHNVVFHASPDNDGGVPEVSLTVTGDATWGDEAEPDVDQVVENDDGTTTVRSIDLDVDGLDSYLFDGEVVDYHVSDGYDVDVSLDGEVMSFEELLTEDTSDDPRNGSDGRENAPNHRLPKRLIVEDDDGSGVSTYQVSVTGDVRKISSATGGKGLLDRFVNVARDGKIMGMVHRGKDVYRYSGTITSLTVNGDAEITFEEV